MELGTWNLEPVFKELVLKELSMKVLFISHSSVIKYHQQKLDILARKYALEITLVTPPYWPEGGRDEPLDKTFPSIKYLVGKIFFLKTHMLHFYLNADEIVAQEKPDIVHIEEEPFNTPCWQFVLAAKKRKIKTVFFTWENILRKHNPVYSYFENYCVKNCDYMIAGNEAGKTIYTQKGFKKPVAVIPQYGINLEAFPEIAREVPNLWQVLYMGRITPEKGIETLVTAFKGLPENVVLNIAGTGTPEYTALIKNKIKEAGLENKTIFHGHINRDSVPNLLASMHILVLPSLTTPIWKEQFGRVLVEAMASKMVVIGSDSGEIPFVIGKAGLVFPEGQAEELRERIKRVINETGLFLTLAQAGRVRAAEKYTNEKIAAELYEVYKKI